MKWLVAMLILGTVDGVYAQAWKTLPKGVRILGYRNVTTSKIKSNFNQGGSETQLGTQFKIDAATLNAMMGNIVVPGADINQAAYDKLRFGEYKVAADAQLNVHGMGFGYGISDSIMFYAELAFYNANVNAQIKRTKGNNYQDIANYLSKHGGTYNDAVLAENLTRILDPKEGTIQSVITNTYGYKPLGNWTGSGYGDMETGIMAKVLERNSWGVLLYPGVILPTGRQDDPDILQDVGFGDGQYDIFGELATGYIVNDKLAFGTTVRLTYQAPTRKTLRIPNDPDFPLSSKSGEFDVKYGNKFNFMVNATYSYNDWIAFTPIYRFMRQGLADYDSEYGIANDYLSYNSDKEEHQAQFTTTFSSITPFLKKKFLLPAQVNLNAVQTIAGKNVPSVGRFEVEFRMLF